MVTDRVRQVTDAVRVLAANSVMVGVPAEKSSRKGTGPSNAELAYIHDNGAPEANIPARPFMEPGIKSAQTEISNDLKTAAELALDGRADAVERQLHRAGLRGELAVKAKINEGIPPPLAMSTLRGRARRGRKGAQKVLAAYAAGKSSAPLSWAKPLVDTGQMRNAVTHVLRKS